MEKKLSFNDVPEQYDMNRPQYPEQLITDIINYSSLNSHSEVLEIGPGTGQITLPLAKKGYSFTGIELGENLANYLQNKLLDCPNAKIINSSFENWDNRGKLFDLVISAQAFHWIDPRIGYPKVANLLKDKGKLALIWIYHPRTELIDQLDKVYLSLMPDYKKLEDVETRISEQIEEINASNHFDNLRIYKYQYEMEYTAEQYVDLLDTYSDHRTMDYRIKAKLYSEIKKIINNSGGLIIKPYIATLYLSDKRK